MLHRGNGMPDAIERSGGHWKIHRGSAPDYSCKWRKEVQGNGHPGWAEMGSKGGEIYHRIIENYEDGK